MLWIYDKVIADDLRKSINPLNMDSSPVKVIDVEQAIGVVAQMKADEIEYPIVVLNRGPDNSIDRDRTNFTRMHKGVHTVIDNKTNELFYERVIPINLNYVITVLATNTADADEITRELLFKYTDMYFISFVLPYEAHRKVRIGVVIDPNSNIERSSAAPEYLSGGSLYQTIIPIKIEGAVLVNYVPAKLQRVKHEIVTEVKS